MPRHVVEGAPCARKLRQCLIECPFQERPAELCAPCRIEPSLIGHYWAQMQEAGRSWTTIRPSRAPVRRPCAAQCWKCIHTRTSLRPPDVVAARRVSLLLARSQPKPGAEERAAFDPIDQLKEEEVITTAAEAPPAETVGVRIALAVLNFYKREISPLIPPSCRFVPTCSEYGMEAYKRFGVPKGTVLTAWRLLNCNPLGAILLPRMARKAVPFIWWLSC